MFSLVVTIKCRKKQESCGLVYVQYGLYIYSAIFMVSLLFFVFRFKCRLICWVQWRNFHSIKHSWPWKNKM